MRSTQMPLSKLVHNTGQVEGLPKNPRFIRDTKYEKLLTSLREDPEMMELRELIAYDTGRQLVVIAGNMRLRALRELKQKTAPVKILPTKTPADKLRAYTIKDNVGYGEDDWDILADEWDIQELEDWGMDIPDLPHDADDLSQYEQIDPTPPKTTNIKKGDLIEIGSHRLFCGDATEPADVDALMGERLADMAHNDPPYGMGKENDGVMNDNLNQDKLLAFNLEWVPLQIAKLKTDSSFYCWGRDRGLMDLYAFQFRPMITAEECAFRNLITWNKSFGQGQNSEKERRYANADEKCLFVMMGPQRYPDTSASFFPGFEPIRDYLNTARKDLGWSIQDCIKAAETTSASHWFAKSQWFFPAEEPYEKMRAQAPPGSFKLSHKDMREKWAQPLAEFQNIKDNYYQGRAYFDNIHDNMNSVWHFDRATPGERNETGGHATPKPVALCARAVKSSSPEGGLVLDYFLGSGSTMVAAHATGRQCFGMELDPLWCQVVVDRMMNIAPELIVKINGEPYDPKA